MTIPSNLKYTNDHEWVRVEGNTAVVGITDYAQSQLGDIVFVDVQTVGDALERGDVFGAIEAVKTVADAYMPLSGEITERNAALDDAPELLNTDPYGEGWMVKVKIADRAQLDELLTPEDYGDII
ncbi:MAG: glycine cleavage system protein GcvH [Prevotellaceae bacterium]|jgi:glycine cleavage system H protein|nr:glycine cleavage system protein GcvH [Prevotellaceae bacterium]